MDELVIPSEAATSLVEKPCESGSAILLAIACPVRETVCQSETVGTDVVE